MKSSRMSVAVGIVALIAAIAYNVLAEEPAINPAKVTTPQIAVYGTTYDNTIAGNLNIAGTLTTTGTVTSAALLKCYGYAVDVGPSASQVYMTQVGTNNCAGGTIQTNTFSPVYIATPTVIYKFSAVDKLSTNTMTVSTNQFLVNSAAATGDWIAYGRIK